MLKRDQMKIALIGTTAGCVLGFRIDLIKLLVAEGHKVYAFALDYDEESIKKVKAIGAIPVQYKFNRSGLNPINDLLNTYRLSRQLRQIRADISFSYFAKPVIFGSLAAVLAGVKRRIAMLEGLGYVFTNQPEGEAGKTRFLRKIQIFLYRLSFPFLERIIFLNHDDPVDLIDKNRLHVKQISVLGGIGLDLNSYPFSAPSISPVSFIFIGRLLKEKGVYDYLSAAKLVKQKYPDITFYLLGGVDTENPGAISLDNINQLVSEGIITYPGHVNNVSEWLSSASVFVLPSYREGVPRSTQEAMAIGRPIITTDVPGCRETVIDGRNGFLVAPWSPDELAQKMIYFIENPEKILEMGMQSYQIAQSHFDAVKVNEKLLSFFRETNHA